MTSQLCRFADDKAIRRLTVTVSRGRVVIDICGAISNALADQMRERVLQDDIRRARLVEFVIESAGGDDPAGFALYEIVRALPMPVVATTRRQCYSAALTMFMAADYRRCAPAAAILLHRVHQPVAAIASTHPGRVNARDLKSAIASMEAANRRLAGILAVRTGHRCIAEIEAEIDTEELLSSASALHMGIVHEIFDCTGRPSLATFDSMRSLSRMPGVYHDASRYGESYRRAAEVAAMEEVLLRECSANA